MRADHAVGADPGCLESIQGDDFKELHMATAAKVSDEHFHLNGVDYFRDLSP